MSQESLAADAGLSQTWISHLESGRINPQWGTVRMLARALGLPLDELARLAEELEPTRSP